MFPLSLGIDIVHVFVFFVTRVSKATKQGASAEGVPTTLSVTSIGELHAVEAYVAVVGKACIGEPATVASKVVVRSVDGVEHGLSGPNTHIGSYASENGVVAFSCLS